MATAGAAILIATVAVAPAAAAQRPIPHTNCSAYASRDPTPGGGLSCRRGKHRHWLFVTCIQYKRGGAWHNKTCRTDQGTAPAGRFGAGIQWLGGFKESCNRSYRTATIAEVRRQGGRRHQRRVRGELHRLTPVSPIVARASPGSNP